MVKLNGPFGAGSQLASLSALEPDYATALAYAAWCHETLFVRAGMHEENRIAMSRYAHAALIHGRDDATALTIAGFCIGMIEHDRATAFQAFDAALALSPSSAFTYIFGSALSGWPGEAERALDWGERALRLSPFDPLNSSPSTGSRSAISYADVTLRPPRPPARRSRSIPCSASVICLWWRRSRGSERWTRPKRWQRV